MKRKTFIIASTAAVVAIASVPAIKYFNNRTKKYDPLIMPDELSRFCDEKEIRAIGASYRNLVPQENEKNKLSALLLASDGGKAVAATDKYAVIELLDKKVQKDFNDYNLQVINGWVISTTEARQCALFSLT